VIQRLIDINHRILIDLALLEYVIVNLLLCGTVGAFCCCLATGWCGSWATRRGRVGLGLQDVTVREIRGR